MFWLDKEVKKIIKELIFMSIIVVITLMIWPNISAKAEEQNKTLSMYYDNLIIENIDNTSNTLYSVNNNDISGISPINVVLRNTTKDNREYNLYLKVLKVSTLDINYINIFVDDIKNLSSLYSYEDDDALYYLLETSNINKYAYIVKDIKIWLNDSNNVSGKSLNYTFVIKEK
ncbi:MAG: hypothetical protein Q4G04_06765 [bacterium]|nr:hypothetical protein [bacterium]